MTTDSLPQKQCPHCNLIKPFTDFCKNRTRSDGYDTWCKMCVSETRKQQRIDKRIADYDNWPINNEGKICPRCKERKPLSEFHRNKRSRTSVDPYCKPCASIRLKESRHANPERFKEISRRRYLKNKDERLAKDRQRRKDHPEIHREYGRRYYYTNRERLAMERKEYRRVHKAKYAEFANRRRCAEGKFTAEDIEQMYDEQNGYCAYCGINMHDDYEIEHYIPISKGGTNWPDNLLLACPDCNLSKYNKMPDEWVASRGW